MSQASSVHWLPSSHSTAAPAVHLPPLQASPSVQASPSLQPPSAGVVTQPFFASQPSLVQGLASSHTTVAAIGGDTQAPSAQTSARVQASPSLHLPPSLMALALHFLSSGSHCCTRQTSPSPTSQVITVAGFTKHPGGSMAILQYNVPLHGLPSSKASQRSPFGH